MTPEWGKSARELPPETQVWQAPRLRSVQQPCTRVLSTKPLLGGRWQVGLCCLPSACCCTGAAPGVPSATCPPRRPLAALCVPRTGRVVGARTCRCAAAVAEPPSAPRACACLLPTAQFLLAELEDGSYATILPLISQDTFRGTLRPPR